MQLRFSADRRTLFWAFVLFPLGPALAYARPGLLPFLAPLLLYCSYCSGVLSHNHNHAPVFTARWANEAYGAWLSFFYGFPTFAWVPTHNQNHHRFVNAEGDATRTTRRPAQDSLFTALSYPIACSAWQLPSVVRYARQALSTHPKRARRVRLESSALVLGHAGMLLLACALHGVGVGALVYGATLGLPAALGTYWMMLTNYLQHVNCKPGSEFDHSRNFVSPFFNWFVFENGLHTVHHHSPGLHWSRSRALHRLVESRIDPRLCEDHVFGYFFRTYLAPGRRRDAATA